jgi:hypothetical protein
MVMGTAPYVSPEQAQGKVTEIDHRSDIFSFGCILYEAATARRAFDGEAVLDSLHKIVHVPTPHVREVNPDAPAALDRIVRRCLMKDPEKRYQAIKDVAIELEEVQHELKGQPEPARAPSSESPRPGAVAGTATEHTAPAVASTAELRARPTSNAEYLVGELKRHKTGVGLIVGALIIVIGGAGLLLFFVRQGYSGRHQSVGTTLVSFGRMKLTRLTTSGRALDAAISADGKYVAYATVETAGGPAAQGGGTASIWIRQVATGRDIRIVEPGQFIPRGMTFSPDSNYLYYRKLTEVGERRLDIWRVPVLA